MHSFTTAIIALIAVVTTLTTSTNAHQPLLFVGDTVSPSAAGVKFRDTGYSALSTLAVGPYSSSSLEAVKSHPPITASEAGSGQLFKRQCNCPAGFGCCSGGKCCPTNTLCSTSGGCCDSQYPYTCGNKYCCPYQRCTSDGHCGCSGATETRCGSFCCYNGCTADGKSCACASSSYTLCKGGLLCCPAGSVCAGNGVCQVSNATTIAARSLDTIINKGSSKAESSGNSDTSDTNTSPANAAKTLEHTSSSTATLLVMAAVVMAALMT